MAMIAAKTDIDSMGSFFRNNSAFFILLLPFTRQIRPAQYTSQRQEKQAGESNKRGSLRLFSERSEKKGKQ